MIGGIYLKLRLGKIKTLPAPRQIIDSIQSIEVTNNDRGRDGFQISFFTGRSRQYTGDPSSYSLINNELLKPFNRLIMTVTFGSTEKVLFDGIITHHQLSASNSAGQSNFTITGEDLSVLMDITEEGETYQNQDHKTIVESIVNKPQYKKYGLKPQIEIPKKNTGARSDNERVLFKPGTDLHYIQCLAKLHDFIFCIKPTDTVEENIAYWGPLDVQTNTQTALSVNMGPQTNVSSINFQYEPLKPYLLKGIVELEDDNTLLPIEILKSSRPSLSKQQTIIDNQPNVRVKQFRDSGSKDFEARAKAQSQVDESTDSVTASGELDALRYSDILRTSRMSGAGMIRGAGSDYDGKYYVKSVTHNIKRGDYRQSFILTRDGLGSTVNTINHLTNLL